MCQSHSSNSPGNRPDRDWLEKLWEIIGPLSLMTGLFGVVLVVARDFDAPIRLDPDYTWVLKGYLLLYSAALGLILCTIAYRNASRTFRLIRLATRYFSKRQKVSGMSIEICALNESLGAAYEDLSGVANGTSRAPEVSREIVGLTERMNALTDARGALQEEIDEIITEIEKQSGRKIRE